MTRTDGHRTRTISTRSRAPRSGTPGASVGSTSLYVQAALSPGQSPVTTLMLIAKLLGQTSPSSAGRTIDPRTVKLIVHEYVRWAMRVDEPGQNPEYIEMARFLDRKAERGEAIGVEPLDEYLADVASAPFEVREAQRGDAELLRQIAEVYGRCFPPSSTALPPEAFGEALASGRHEGKSYRYHLWGLADRETRRLAGMASYYSFRRVGFGGYLCLERPLAGRGLLKRVVGCIEREMVNDGLEPQGWLIECDPHRPDTIAKFESVGFAGSRHVSPATAVRRTELVVSRGHCSRSSTKVWERASVKSRGCRGRRLHRGDGGDHQVSVPGRRSLEVPGAPEPGAPDSPRRPVGWSMGGLRARGSQR